MGETGKISVDPVAHFSQRNVNAEDDLIKFNPKDKKEKIKKGKYTQSYFIRKFQKWQKVIETKMKIKKKVIDIWLITLVANRNGIVYKLISPKHSWDTRYRIQRLNHLSNVNLTG